MCQFYSDSFRFFFLQPTIVDKRVKSKEKQCNNFINIIIRRIWRPIRLLFSAAFGKEFEAFEHLNFLLKYLSTSLL
jgi:hypothetical protein